jgi:hypothetical protein
MSLKSYYCISRNLVERDEKERERQRERERDRETT